MNKTKRNRLQQQLVNISTRCIFLNNKYVFCVKKRSELNYLDIFHLENRVNLLKKCSQIWWVKFKSWKLVVIEQLLEFGDGHGRQVPGKCLIKKCIWYWEIIHMSNMCQIYLSIIATTNLKLGLHWDTILLHTFMVFL